LDNGGEYTSKEFEVLAQAYFGEKIQFWSVPYMEEKQHAKMEEKQHAKDRGKEVWHTCRQT
jgi:hypothetical protein